MNPRIQGFSWVDRLEPLPRGATSPSRALAELLERDFDDVNLIEVDSLNRFQEASAEGFDVFLADYAVVGGTGVDAWNLLEHGDNQPLS